MQTVTGIDFAKGNEEGLARFIAQLVREGVTYTVDSRDWGWRVILTGGF